MEIDITGKTIEEAVETARAQYNLGDAFFAYEVVEYPKQGFLGIGGKPAVIRINYTDPNAPKPVFEPVDEEPRRERRERRDRSDRRERRERPERRERRYDEDREPDVKPEPKPAAEIVDVAFSDEEKAAMEAYVRGILERMEVTEYELEIGKTDDGKISVKLQGDEFSSFMRKQGGAVDGLQVLLSLYLNKGQDDFRKVSVDVNCYKQKMARRLEALAVRVGRQVQKTHRRVTLNPMSAYQRRIIHAKIQEFKNLTTYSVGTEPNRRVVISYVYPEGRRPRKPENETEPQNEEQE